jgi:hypothetical protein
MNGRAVAIHGGLAMLGLTAAYLTWQRQPELQTGEVFVLDITKNELQMVRFDDEEAKTWAELQLANDDTGSFVTLRLSGREATEAKTTPPSPSAGKAIPERSLRGSDAAKTLYERFAPLRAVRALGVMDPAKLKDLGLATPKKRLTVQTRSGRRVFDLAPAPLGGTDPYLRDQSDGRVFVVARAILSDFQSASTNLVERHLHSFRLEEADRVSLTAGAAKKDYRIARSADGRGVEIALASIPDKPDSTARTWQERAFGLWATESLGKGEKPAEGEPATKLRLEYFGRGRSLGWMELAEASGSEAVSTAAPTPKKALYARSEMTAGWVKLSADNESLFAEGEKLIGGKP